MLEATILLAVIVRDHRIESLANRVPLVPRITLHPAAPVPCRMTAVRAQPSIASRSPAKIWRRCGRSQLRNVGVTTRAGVAHEPPRSTR